MKNQIPPLLFSVITEKNKRQYEDLYQHCTVFRKKSHHIHIAIYPSWLDEYSYPRKDMYSWAYHVRIENHNDIPIYILKKNWNIITEHNQITTIDIELDYHSKAQLNPNEVCEYTSCITLNTSSNIINGFYSISTDMKNITHIDIPTFTLDSPYDLFSIN